MSHSPYSVPLPLLLLNSVVVIMMQKVFTIQLILQLFGYVRTQRGPLLSKFTTYESDFNKTYTGW